MEKVLLHVRSVVWRLGWVALEWSVLYGKSAHLERQLAWGLALRRQRFLEPLLSGTESGKDWSTSGDDSSPPNVRFGPLTPSEKHAAASAWNMVARLTGLRSRSLPADSAKP